MGSDEQFSEQNQGGSCAGSRSRQRHSGRRKEKVLHTRVSEQLSEDIKRLADDLRVPVSNLVRNVLEEVFTVVENVSEDVGEFFGDVIDEAEGVRERIRNQHHAAQASRRETRRGRRHGATPSGAARAGAADVEAELESDEAAEAREEGQRAKRGAAPEQRSGVLGWQPILLNRAVACEGCGVRLEAGANAFVAISQAGAAGKVVCPSCGAPS